MARGPLSEEQKAAMKAGRERAAAAKAAAAGVELTDPVTPVTPKPTKLRVLTGLLSHPREVAAMRVVKFVQPECQVTTQGKDGQADYTTGPCQVEAANDGRKLYTWFRTCDHGPKVDDEGRPLPQADRPYYEQSVTIERTPVVENGVVIRYEETPRYKIVLRLKELPYAKSIGALSLPHFVLAKGARYPEEFGVAPFCQMLGCWRQGLTAYKNGNFCSDIHAKLVAAYDSGIIIPRQSDPGLDPEGRSSELREERFRSVSV